MTYPEADKILPIITDAHTIVILQADNPDADSLGSALALEQLLGDLGHEPLLYCGVDIPEYLRYLPGWDRVQKDLPAKFDASIIVDASTYTLFEKIELDPRWNQLKIKPVIVLDHHTNVEKPIDFAEVTICDNTVASAGELIYVLAKDFGWNLSATTCEFIMSSILGDTQGLMNDLTKASTYRVMAELVELGADRPKLEETRREYSKMPQSIYGYKGTLIGRTEFAADGRIAYVTVPQDEINTFSPLYNPGPLVQFDMMQVIGVQLSIVFKTYDDGKVTGALRATNGYGIAGELATQLGGGGHPYAAGFKVVDGQTFAEVKNKAIKLGIELLDAIAADKLAKER